MNILVVLAHPNPGSFNHAIARAAVEELNKLEHRVVFHDLYQEGFDPILPYSEFEKDAVVAPETAAHCRDLTEAEGIIVIHPNWWGQPPAILKGWVDRVIRPGGAYEFLEGDGGEGVPAGLLRAEVALVLNTSNTPARREVEAFGDPLQLLWKNCIFDLCGVKSFHRRMFEVVVTSTAEERAAWLAEVRRMAAGIFPHRPYWGETL